MNRKTYYYLRYHIVFTTKYRQKIFTRDMLKKARDHFKEKANRMGILIYIMNGYKDHVHI